MNELYPKYCIYQVSQLFTLWFIYSYPSKPEGSQLRMTCSPRLVTITAFIDHCLWDMQISMVFTNVGWVVVIECASVLSTEILFTR